MPLSLDQRIVFHPEDEVLEIDLTALLLADSNDVAALYDRLEARVAETGKRWFFLVNYRDTRIYPEAWLAFAARGKRFNLASSLGTVRFNTAEETGSEIMRRASAEEFDANLARNRQGAMKRLSAIRDEYRRLHPAPTPLDPALLAEMNGRVSFDRDEQVMEADFSEFRFTDSRMVNGFYDILENRIAGSGAPKWYFLVNYRNCEIYPEAWISFAHRGKQLNVEHSLGSVRFRAADKTADQIRERADQEHFDPNLFDSRDAALHRIREMRGVVKSRI